MTAPETICPKRQLRRMVADAFGVEETMLLGRSRKDRVVRARYAFAFVLRQRWPTLSYPRIARLLGGRDHSTIIHGLRRFNEWMAADSHLAALVAGLVAGQRADQHDAHVAAWHMAQMATAADRDRMARIALSATVRHQSFQGAVATGVRLVSENRKVKPRNALVEDDYDALRRRAGSDALGAAIAAAGGWPVRGRAAA